MELSNAQAWAAEVLAWAARQGVAEFCVCAGSRNGPLLAALAAGKGTRVRSFFEERSAAFFALGRARALGRPVAIVTTSGTAVAECLPAVIEAHYQGVPLLVITADRPRRYRGTGAPQSIEQVGLFGSYVRGAFDGERSEAPQLLGTSWDLSGPFHLNVCLDEPLLGAPALTLDLTPSRPVPVKSGGVEELDRERLAHCLGRWKRPVLIVSRLAPEDRAAVRDFALRWGAPVFLEASSGLREDPALSLLRLSSGDRLLSVAGFDGVFRIGSVPTLRFWRDLEEKFATLPVVTLDPRGLSGLSRGDCFRGRPSEVLPELRVAKVGGFETLFARDCELLSRKLQLVAQEPGSEPAIFHHLSRRIPDSSLVFLGNSLPIREWDLTADLRHRKHRIEANRGANGIDGEVSTFLGLAADTDVPESWGIFGDLTALYDLAGPWACTQMAEQKLRIVVINNGGGRIFGRLPTLRRHVGDETRRRLFETRHPVGFEGWAKIWNLGFELWEDGVSPHPPGADQLVVEIRPNEESTERFWRAYDALWESLG